MQPSQSPAGATVGAARESAVRHVVVMGVSGTGKTTVGEALAARLGADFVEGDRHHPGSNIAKMSAGVPLTDEDRMPWLATLAGILAEHHARGRSTVLACSALRRRYRDLLRAAVPEGSLFFVHLHGSYEALRDRMSSRPGHFMPESLLRSQLDTLEPLGADEAGVVVDVAAPVDLVVTEAALAIEAVAPG